MDSPWSTRPLGKNLSRLLAMPTSTPLSHSCAAGQAWRLGHNQRTLPDGADRGNRGARCRGTLFAARRQRKARLLRARLPPRAQGRADARRPRPGRDGRAHPSRGGDFLPHQCGAHGAGGLSGNRKEIGRGATSPRRPVAPTAGCRGSSPSVRCGWSPGASGNGSPSGPTGGRNW